MHRAEVAEYKSKSVKERVKESEFMEPEQPEKGARRFEELWVWQQARELVKEIYEDLRSGSGSKDFGFREQIQRAGVSVMNNIAEGFERFTEIEFARFLDVARGSCGRSAEHVLRGGRLGLRQRRCRQLKTFEGAADFRRHRIAGFSPAEVKG